MCLVACKSLIMSTCKTTIQTFQKKSFFKRVFQKIEGRHNCKSKSLHVYKCSDVYQPFALGFKRREMIWNHTNISNFLIFLPFHFRYAIQYACSRLRIFIKCFLRIIQNNLSLKTNRHHLSDYFLILQITYMYLCVVWFRFYYNYHFLNLDCLDPLFLT